MILITPIILYVINSISILLTVVIKEEKSSDFIGVFIIMIISLLIILALGLFSVLIGIFFAIIQTILSTCFLRLV